MGLKIIMNSREDKYKENLSKTHHNKIIDGSPDCLVVKNLPCNAGDMGSIPGHKTKIPYSMEHLSMHKAKTEPVRKDLA